MGRADAKRDGDRQNSGCGDTTRRMELVLEI